ncbi:polyphosphate polymerase domain-containing protein (plasmid) [Ensifer sp. D2-11]
MSTIAITDGWLEWVFEPISLDTLNAKAAMLERLDNKYVVGAAVLSRAATELALHFDVLEINGRRSFTYETCYFDGADRQSYFDHHQGRRRRAKVRIRKYLEADLCFVEVKLKDKRGATIKKRLPYDPGKFGVLDDAALGYVDRVYFDQYGQHFPYELSRVIDMRYVRMTLVAKEGGERMTIDGQLHFFAPGSSHAVRDDRFILETKSANGNGIADRLLRTLHQHPTRNCSKYCTGIAILNQTKKHNKFLPALRKLGGVPAPQGVLVT